MTTFEIKHKDLAGRIGKLRTSHGFIETPNIFPVINPNKMIVKPKDMEKFGAEAVITNAYILWKNFTEEVMAKGVHDFLGFNGPIMTDSGAFQLMEYGDVEVSNAEIIDFQKRIGVDIGVILDIPTIGDHALVKKGVEETIKRGKESQKLIKGSDVLWCGPIQGNVHTDLLKKCAKEMGKLDFRIHPIGSIVPLLKQYRFAPHIEIIKTCKEILPENRPLHLFGAGHPMFFSFAVAMGIDLFDSAAYALYAKGGRYLTQTGTEKLDELSYLPCSCLICSKYEINEINEKRLAEHNLYVTFEELRLIKQCIREGTLFELLERRARSHPSLLECMNHFVKYDKFVEKYDSLTKKHFFYLSDFSKHRSEIPRTKRMVKGIKSKKVNVKPFGMIPCSILDCYPFSQTVLPEEKEIKKQKVSDIQKIQDVSRYWYGVNIFDKDVKIRKSRATGKIRQVYDKKGKLIASFRASDFMIILHNGAEILHKESKKHRVTVINDKEIHGLIRNGKTLFTPHVKKASKDIIPRQQVLIVTDKDKLLATGEALLNEKEMMDFNHGVAVKTRKI